jgi:hypothetical protein
MIEEEESETAQHDITSAQLARNKFKGRTPPTLQPQSQGYFELDKQY